MCAHKTVSGKAAERVLRDTLTFDWMIKAQTYESENPSERATASLQERRQIIEQRHENSKRWKTCVVSVSESSHPSVSCSVRT